MDKQYEHEQSVMFTKMTSLRYRTEKDLYSNGTAPKPPSFRDKYVIKSLRPFNEDKFALLVFYCSLSLVITKILFVNRELFYDVFFIFKSLFTLDGDVFLRIQTGVVSLWAIVSAFNWITVPVLIGLASSFITWRTVYLDSCIPGVKPPSPFKAKLSTEPIKWYHMGYGLAIYFGIVAFFIAFFAWNSLVG